VYSLRVASIQTLNYEGKRKRRKTGKRTSAFFRTSDYKKVYRCCSLKCFLDTLIIHMRDSQCRVTANAFDDLMNGWTFEGQDCIKLRQEAP
jgi:hypothetical protein